MVIYLKGKHGIRTSFTEAAAVLNEKDGYKRIDINAYIADKRAAMKEDRPHAYTDFGIKPKKRGRPRKNK